MKLGHKFEDIFKAIKAEKEAKLIVHIDALIKKYSLLSIDTNNLRYPKKGDKFLLFDGYLKPDNEFDELFDTIASEISRGIINKFYDDK